MTLGKRRKQREQDLFIASTSMPRSPGHPFYQQLNRLLDEAGFDEEVEALCKPLYVEGCGRPSIPPGVYFRMLLVGYFEGIDSQRGIAWRCADSRSLQEFLGLGPTDSSPDHSSLTRVRKRLPVEIHSEAFALVVRIARDKGLVKGKKLAVDSTTLEANAAMKSIVRRDTGDNWSEYVRGLAEEAGIEDLSEDDLRRFDRKRPGKKVSNKDWKSPSDPDARITKMKDGRTRMAYKAQHAIDADTEIIVAATIHYADEPDSEVIKDTLTESAGVLALAGAELIYEDVIADKGYHKAETLAWLVERGMRTYVSEPKSPRKRRWSGKPTVWKDAYRGNRRRAKGERSSSLHRLRSERVERSFAHTCRTGRARRAWIRGVEEVNKRYMIQAAARNLGTIMRTLFGIGTPRALQSGAERLLGPLARLLRALCALLVQFADLRRSQPVMSEDSSLNPFGSVANVSRRLRAVTSTAC